VSTPDPVPPAYYAGRPGPAGDWWTLLHPPYTAWHLAYVVIGAALAPHVDGARLAATLLAFFLAVGVGAHAADELHGRPLQSAIPTPVLVVTTGVSLTGAVAIGIAGIAVVGWRLAPFVAIGPVLAIGYCLELFGGRLHTDLGFALAWGAFPVVTAYVAQVGDPRPGVLLVAAGATLLALAQRSLSTPARGLRRRSAGVDGAIRCRDGRIVPLDVATLLAPLERTLRLLSWSVVTLAVGLLALRAH